VGVDPGALEVGDELLTLTREGSVLSWVRYAAVNPAHIVGHHFEDEVGRYEGFDGAFIMAPLEHAYLHVLLRDWMGLDGRVVRLDIRLRRPLIRGRTMTAGGSISSLTRDGDSLRVELDLWERDDLGELLAPATAEVVFPPRP
jgi:hypothetical protein